MKIWLIACVCAVALAVSGCSIIEGLGASSGPKTEPQPEQKTDRAAEELARREAALERARAAERKRQAELEALRSVPRPGRKPEIVRPERLIGLDRASAQSMFGPPHFVSNEAPATVWFYRGTNCVLRLYFYPDLATNTFRTLTYEFTALDSEESGKDVEICASGLRWAHAAPAR